MAERTPNFLASYDDAATTPLDSGGPPTATGLTLEGRVVYLLHGGVEGIKVGVENIVDLGFPHGAILASLIQ